MNDALNLTAESVVERLATELPVMSRRIRQAAGYIIDHPFEVSVHSMRTLASRAKVHPTTLTRLAKAAGFDSYEAFRNLFRDSVRQISRPIPDRAEWLQSLGAGSKHALIVQGQADAILRNLAEGFTNLAASELETVARKIVHSRRTYVMAIRGAFSLAHSFCYVAGMAIDNLQLVPRFGASCLDDLINVSERDVVLAISLAPYARETITAARFAKDKGATVIGVTDSRGSPLFPISDHILFGSAETPQFFNSLVTAMALLETLIAMIVAVGDEKMVRTIRSYDELRRQSGAYWQED